MFQTWQWRCDYVILFNLLKKNIPTALSYTPLYAPFLTIQSFDVPRSPPSSHSPQRHTDWGRYVIPHSPLFSSTSSSPIGGQQNVHQSTQPQTPQGQSNFSDSSGPLFNMYVKMAEQEDDKMADRWQKDADGILIFVSSHTSFHTAVTA